MPKKRPRSIEKISKLELSCGFLSAMPIPIIGEIAGTYFFYKNVKHMPLVKNDAQALLLAVSVTALMRISLYNTFPYYKTAYDKLIQFN